MKLLAIRNNSTLLLICRKRLCKKYIDNFIYALVWWRCFVVGKMYVCMFLLLFRRGSLTSVILW